MAKAAAAGTDQASLLTPRGKIVVVALYVGQGLCYYTTRSYDNLVSFSVTAARGHGESLDGASIFNISLFSCN